MKRIVVLIAGGFIILSSFSPGPALTFNKDWKDKYCAVIKDGERKMMNGNTELVVDITLENGTVITTDGYLISKDGVRTALKNGECVDKAGNIIESKKSKDKK